MAEAAALALWGLVALHLLLLARNQWPVWKALPTKPIAKGPPADVVVCLHNEAPDDATARELALRLQALATQTYQPYTLWLVNDRSTDATAQVLKQVAHDFGHVKVLALTETPTGWSPKKWALQHALHQSSALLLVFTDADCRVGPHWLAHMAGALVQPDTRLVLGLSPYDPKPGLLSALVQHESMCTAALMCGQAARKKPYMALGRNWGIRRAALPATGWQAWAQVLGGDDDLMVNHLARPVQTQIVLDPAAQTHSQPPGLWRDWLRQKRRHVAPSRFYRRSDALWLAALHVPLVAVPLLSLLAAAALQLPTLLVPWAALLAGRWGIFMPFAQRTKHWKALRRFIPLEALFSAYLLVVVPQGWVVKTPWTTRKPAATSAPKSTGG